MNFCDGLADTLLRSPVDNDGRTSPAKPEPMAKPIPAVEPVTSAILFFNCKSTTNLLLALRDRARDIQIRAVE
jgi:hypothetical protein